jgi:hypothetical protein
MGNRFPHVVIVGGDFGDAKKKCVFVDGADRLGVTSRRTFSCWRWAPIAISGTTNSPLMRRA